MNIDPDYAAVAVIATTYFLALLSPVIAAAYLAMFKGRDVPGRWLFVFFGPAIAYAILLVATVTFFLPFYLIGVFLVPALRDLGHNLPFWVPFLDWVINYDYLIISTLLVALSAWLVRYVWPRWPGVLAAMANPAVKRDAPQAARPLP